MKIPPSYSFCFDFQFCEVDCAFRADVETAAAACSKAFLAVIFCNSLVIDFDDFKSFFRALFCALFADDTFVYQDFEKYAYLFEDGKPTGSCLFYVFADSFFNNCMSGVRK